LRGEERRGEEKRREEKRGEERRGGLKKAKEAPIKLEEDKEVGSKF